MRILVLNQYFHPDGAASAQLLTELCEDLAQRHDVWVVAGRPSYNVSCAAPTRGLFARERHGRVNVVRVWSTSFSRASMAGRLINYVSYLATALAGAFVAPRPDVVMSWTDPPPIGAVGVLASRLRRAPFVLSCQDITPEAPVISGDLRNPLLIRLLRANARLIFRHAAKVVSIGRDMSLRLEELGVPREKIVTIWNWSDERTVAPLEEASSFRREQGWEERFVIMHSGNIGLSQDLETLIDAAVLLKDQEDILIAIVGEGASKARLIQKTTRLGLNNVQFVPFQPKSMLAQSLGAADVHLVSHKRGLVGYQVPSKLYGILAAGKPLIGSVEPGSETARVIDEYACGSRVDAGDADSLAACIAGMRDAPLEDMGKAARRAFEERYKRSDGTSAYERLLTDVAGPNDA